MTDATITAEPIVLVPVNPATARAIAAALAMWEGQDTSANPAWGIATSDSRFDAASSEEIVAASSAFRLAADAGGLSLGDVLDLVDGVVSSVYAVVAGKEATLHRPSPLDRVSGALVLVTEAVEEAREDGVCRNEECREDSTGGEGEDGYCGDCADRGYDEEGNRRPGCFD